MLDEFRSTNITWDKATRRIYSPITANASDSNGRKLNIQVVNSGQVENLTGATLHLYWETKDKAHDGLDAFDASDISKGEFELFYTTGMLSNVGELNATLVLVDSTGKVVSDWFKITVTRGINESAIESENSFSSLTKALIDISNLEQNYAPRLNDLTAQLQQTEQELSSQLADKAEQTTVANQQAQINALVVGSGTSSAEVVQARVDAIGSTFPTVKSHMDNIEQLIKTGKSALVFADWQQGSILVDGTLNVINTYIRNADLHYLDVGTKLTITPVAGYKLGIAWYDQTQTFVRRDGYYMSEFDIMTEYPYYRFMLGFDDVTVLDSTDGDDLSVIASLSTDAIDAIDALKTDVANLASGSALLPNSVKARAAEFIWQNQMIEDGIVTNVGYIRSSNAGLLEANASYNAYDYIPVDALVAHYYKGFNAIGSDSGFGIRFVCFWDANKVLISGAGLDGATNIFTFTPPANAKYCSISTNVTSVSHVVSKKQKIDRYFTHYLNDDIYLSGLSDYPLAGKKVYAFGTSITHGHVLDKGYPNYLTIDEGIVLMNYAVNGATVRGSSIITQVTNASAAVPDCIMFDGSANDAYTTLTNDPVAMGTITPGFTEALDLNTYCGSFENICKSLAIKYMGAAIIHVCVHKLVGRDYVAQETLHNLNIQICKKWGIAVVDLFHESPLNSFIAAYKNAYSYDTAEVLINGSGTHPNEIGYRKFYLPPVKAKMIELLTN